MQDWTEPLTSRLSGFAVAAKRRAKRFKSLFVPCLKRVSQSHLTAALIELFHNGECGTVRNVAAVNVTGAYLGGNEIRIGGLSGSGTVVNGVLNMVYTEE